MVQWCMMFSPTKTIENLHLDVTINDLHGMMWIYVDKKVDTPHHSKPMMAVLGEHVGATGYLGLCLKLFRRITSTSNLRPFKG